MGQPPPCWRGAAAGSGLDLVRALVQAPSQPLVGACSVRRRSAQRHSRAAQRRSADSQMHPPLGRGSGCPRSHSSSRRASSRICCSSLRRGTAASLAAAAAPACSPGRLPTLGTATLGLACWGGGAAAGGGTGAGHWASGASSSTGASEQARAELQPCSTSGGGGRWWRSGSAPVTGSGVQPLSSLRSCRCLLACGSSGGGRGVDARLARRRVKHCAPVAAPAVLHLAKSAPSLLAAAAAVVERVQRPPRGVFSANQPPQLRLSGLRRVSAIPNLSSSARRALALRRRVRHPQSQQQRQACVAARSRQRSGDMRVRDNGRPPQALLAVVLELAGRQRWWMVPQSRPRACFEAACPAETCPWLRRGCLWNCKRAPTGINCSRRTPILRAEIGLRSPCSPWGGGPSRCASWGARRRTPPAGGGWQAAGRRAYATAWPLLQAAAPLSACGRRRAHRRRPAQRCGRPGPGPDRTTAAGPPRPGPPGGLAWRGRGTLGRERHSGRTHPALTSERRAWRAGPDAAPRSAAPYLTARRPGPPDRSEAWARHAARPLHPTEGIAPSGAVALPRSSQPPPPACGSTGGSWPPRRRPTRCARPTAAGSPWQVGQRGCLRPACATRLRPPPASHARLPRRRLQALQPALRHLPRASEGASRRPGRRPAQVLPSVRTIAAAGLLQGGSHAPGRGRRARPASGRTG
jgi:hypothetical protein